MNLKKKETTTNGGYDIQCPSPGHYYLQTYFDVPSLYRVNDDDDNNEVYDDQQKDDDDDNNNNGMVGQEEETLHYTPEIRFIFTTGQEQDQQGTIIVGCATTGAAAWNKGQTNKAQQGVWVLAVAILCLLLIFATLLYMSHQRRKRLERLMERSKKTPKQEHVERRYQYFSTLPNGQVIPIPPTTTTTTSSSSQSHHGYSHHYHMDHDDPIVVDSMKAAAARSGDNERRRRQQGATVRHLPPSFPTHRSSLSAAAVALNNHSSHHTLFSANSVDSNSPVAVVDTPPTTGGNATAAIGGGGGRLPRNPLEQQLHSHAHNITTTTRGTPMISNPSYNETRLPIRPVI